VTVATDDVDPDAARAAWASHRFGVPLEVLESPYRDLTEPVLDYLDELDRRWADDTISVIIPEVVVHRWYQHLLHNQSGLALKARLLYRENTVVVSVPWHYDPELKRVHVPGGIVTAGDGDGDREGDRDRPVESGGSAGEQAPAGDQRQVE
jgi:hypothetical protein